MPIIQVPVASPASLTLIGSKQQGLAVGPSLIPGAGRGLFNTKANRLNNTFVCTVDGRKVYSAKAARLLKDAGIKTD